MRQLEFATQPTIAPTRRTPPVPASCDAIPSRFAYSTSMNLISSRSIALAANLALIPSIVCPDCVAAAVQCTS